jgi:hypothetical protein
MRTEVIVSFVGAIIAIFAFIFSLLTYIINHIQNRKELAYRMLYDINMITFQHPEVVISDNDKLTPIQAGYASIVWNFIESVHNLKLNDDNYLKPAISQLANKYSDWYILNKNSYNIKFQKYVKKQFHL